MSKHRHTWLLREVKGGARGWLWVHYTCPCGARKPEKSKSKLLRETVVYRKAKAVLTPRFRPPADRRSTT